MKRKKEILVWKKARMNYIPLASSLRTPFFCHIQVTYFTRFHFFRFLLLLSFSFCKNLFLRMRLKFSNAIIATSSLLKAESTIANRIYRKNWNKASRSVGDSSILSIEYHDGNIVFFERNSSVGLDLVFDFRNYTDVGVSSNQ
jgi:hypothetical protein